MATLQQIRQAVDDRLVTLLAAAQTKQNTFAAAHNGHFWQGQKTHTINPADGTTVLPNIGTTCPVGQPSDPWPAAIRNTAIEMAVQIDVYTSPFGEGWQATVWVDVLGTTYSRTHNGAGDETWRNQGWHIETAGV